MRKTMIFLAAFLLAGCSFRPDMPEIKGEINYQFDKTSEVSKTWWEDFNDENLNSAVLSALENNSDLLIALNNIEMAKLNLGLANKDFLPNIGLEGGASRAGKRYKNSQGELHTDASNKFNLGAALSYEIDLWGRVRNTSRAKKSLFNASKFDYESARLSIASNVVKAYFNLLALNNKQQIIQVTLKSYEDTLRFRKSQLESGVITELVYYQAKASVESAKEKLANVNLALSKAKTSFVILSGYSVDKILNAKLDRFGSMPDAPEVPKGISSDILLHRPDVASSLENLKASNALVGVARASYFPQLSLTAAFGFGSHELDELLKTNAQVWNIGGSLIMPLLDFGRTSNKVDLAFLKQNGAFLMYDKTIKNAFAETKDALQSRENAFIKKEASSELYRAENKVFELSQALYDSGYASHLELLDAQRLLLNSQLSLVDSKLELLDSCVDVYKALGGGFNTNKILEN